MRLHQFKRQIYWPDQNPDSRIKVAIDPLIRSPKIDLGQAKITTLASTDSTGSATLGGNWILEAQTGTVDMASLLVPSYDYLLGVTSISTIAGDNIVNAAEASTVTVSGVVSNSGQPVQITITDGTNVVNGSALTTTQSWSTTLNLSGLRDGTLTVYAKQSNTAGTLTSGDASVTITKDTAGPTAVDLVSGTVGTQATESQYYSGANATSVLIFSIFE